MLLSRLGKFLGAIDTNAKVFSQSNTPKTKISLFRRIQEHHLHRYPIHEISIELQNMISGFDKIRKKADHYKEIEALSSIVSFSMMKKPPGLGSKSKNKQLELKVEKEFRFINGEYEEIKKDYTSNFEIFSELYQTIGTYEKTLSKEDLNFFEPEFSKELKQLKQTIINLGVYSKRPVEHYIRLSKEKQKNLDTLNNSYGLKKTNKILRLISLDLKNYGLNWESKKLDSILRNNNGLIKKTKTK